MKHKNFLRSRAKKFGLPPGTLTSVEKGSECSRCVLIEYTGEQTLKKDNPNLEECINSLKNSHKTWLTFYGPVEEKLMVALGNKLALHPLLMEDIIHSGGRPKVEDYGKVLFIVLHHLETPESTIPLFQVEQTQISILLGDNYVIAFAEKNTKVFSPIIERLNKAQSRLRQGGVDYLCYALIDCICDYYFVSYERIEFAISDMESSIFKSPDTAKIPELQEAKKSVYTLKKSTWPMRDVVSKLLRLDSPLIQKETKAYLQDIFDHLIEASEVTERFRESVESLFEIYLAMVNQKMNEIVKVLTIVSTTFAPITFIASIYGMNFIYMPELSWKWGYYFTLTLMSCIALGMMCFFRRKKWI